MPESPSNKGLPVRVLAVIPAFFPSTIIDVVKPLLEMHRSGQLEFKVTLEFTFKNKDLDWPDLIVFCRNCDVLSDAILREVLRRGIPYIYDIDDNFFEISIDSELGQYYHEPGRLDLLTSFIQFANLVRVYSFPLQEKAISMNPKVEKVVAPVDWNLIKPPKRHPQGVVRIIYTTSRQNDPLAFIVLPALKRILEEYPKQVEVYFWGHAPDDFRKTQDVYFINSVANYEHYLRQFSASGFDIGLAPLLDSIFYRSKTNNKFREFGASRVAGIYSNVDVYSDCVIDGETGLLVTNDADSWHKALKLLIENPDLRTKIHSQAEAYCRQNYNHDRFKSIWKGQIERVLSFNDSKREPTPELPQSNIPLQLPLTASQTSPAALSGRRILLRFLGKHLGPFFQFRYIISLLMHPRQNRALIARKYHSIPDRLRTFFSVIFGWLKRYSSLRWIALNRRWQIFKVNRLKIL